MAPTLPRVVQRPSRKAVLRRLTSPITRRTKMRTIERLRAIACLCALNIFATCAFAQVSQQINPSNFAASGANSDITSLSGMTTPLSVSQGGTGSGAGFVPGNVAVGASNNGLTDSGNQLIKTGVNNRNPGASDDSTQGYSVGSIWVNTSNGSLWAASSVAPTAATWVQAINTVPYSSTGWAFAYTLAANSTAYSAVGAISANQNSEMLISFSATLSNLQIVFTGSPGVGQTYTATVFAGTPRSMVATAITCQVSGASSSCNDSTHSAAITAGQAWAVQLVSSAGAASNSSGAISVGVTY